MRSAHKAFQLVVLCVLTYLISFEIRAQQDHVSPPYHVTCGAACLQYPDGDAPPLGWNTLPSANSLSEGIAIADADWGARYTADRGQYRRYDVGTHQLYDDCGYVRSVSYLQQSNVIGVMGISIGYTATHPNAYPLSPTGGQIESCSSQSYTVLGIGSSRLVGVEMGELDCDTSCGNPINFLAANKFQVERDIDYGFVPLTRYYNSSRNVVSRFLGRGWSHTYDRRIDHFDTGSEQFAQLFRHDGKSLTYKKNSLGAWSSVVRNEGVLEERFENQTFVGWRFLPRTSPEVEIYDALGRLTELRSAYNLENRLAITYLTNANSQALDHLRVASVLDSKGRGLSFQYGPDGRLASVTTGAQVTYTFSYTEDQLTAVTNTHGYARQYLYGEDAYDVSPGYGQRGKLTGILHAGVRFATFEYLYSQPVATSHADGVDRYTVKYDFPVKIGYPLGKLRHVSYQQILGSKRPETITEYDCDENGACSSRSRGYTYGGDGFVATKGNFNGSVTEYTRDSNGNTVSAVERPAVGAVAARTITYVRDPSHPALTPLEEKILDSSGQPIVAKSLMRNSRGQIITRTMEDTANAQLRTTNYSYCEVVDIPQNICPTIGLLLAIDGPVTGDIDKTTFEYFLTDDAGCSMIGGSCGHRMGDLKKIVHPGGATDEVLRYNGVGLPISTKDKNGVVSDFEYNEEGRLTAQKVRGENNLLESDDAITRYEYWPAGTLKRIVDPDGAYVMMHYDAAKRLVALQDALGNRVDFTLDVAGNRIREEIKDSSGELRMALSRVFNQLGQLTVLANAQEYPTDFSYDSSGNVTAVTDALGRIDERSYDSLGRLIRTLRDVNGIAAETLLTYDALDRVKKVTDPKGLDTVYVHDALGGLEQLQSPDSGLTTFTYDSRGNRLAQFDARGVTTQYAYDELGRLVAITYPNSAENVSYSYDFPPPVCQANESYAVGRLSSMTDASGSTHYCYNWLGHLVRKVQVVNGMALVLRYEYTKAGELQRLIYPGNTAIDYGRDALGRVSEIGITVSGQQRQVLVQNSTHHPFGAIAGWVYGNGRALSRTVDQNYRPTGIQDASPGGLLLSMDYDAVGNLTEVASDSPPKIDFTYDALGRLTETRDGTAQVAIDVYTYDKTGNRIARTNAGSSSVNTYSALDHRTASSGGVSRVHDAAGSTTNIGVDREFLYNGAGRMTQVKRAGLVAMNYVYNGHGQQVRKHIGAGNTYTVYDEAGKWLGDYDSVGAPIQQVVWMGELPIGLIAGGNQLFYVEPDHLGTPRVVIDPNRDVPVWTWSIKGEAFGDSAPNEDPDGDSVPFVFDMRFPGQRFDVSSGLSHNGARDYDSTLGRYMQSDPIGLKGGISSYAYALSQPTMQVDPLGLQSSTLVGPGSSQSMGAAGAVNPHSLDGSDSLSAAVPNSGPINLPKFDPPEVTGDGLLSSLWKMSGLGMLSQLEQAISSELNNVCEEDEEYCEAMYRADTDTCKGIARRRGAKRGAICHASAAQRYAACRRGDPIPSLTTWNN